MPSPDYGLPTSEQYHGVFDLHVEVRRAHRRLDDAFPPWTGEDFAAIREGAEALRDHLDKMRVIPSAECDGCLCPTEHDGDYGSSGHPGPCPPHTCGLPPGVDHG